MMKKIFVILMSMLFSSSLAWSATLTDSQIVKVLDTANSGEIAAAKLALSKATKTSVKSFATSMLKEHETFAAEGKKLADSLQLKAADSDISKSIHTKSDTALTHLKALDKAKFDLAYVTGQVKDHQTVLALIDNQLLHDVKNPKLKAFLQSLRPKIKLHLDHATKLLAELKTPHG